jgi:radical SAM/Cys-rich protein
LAPVQAGLAFAPLARLGLAVLQVNLTYRCNQACVHCHVDAGPKRAEEMAAALVDQVLACLAERRIPTLDLTGGAPELHPDFRRLVRGARRLGVRVVDRSNLTILVEPGFEWLAHFLAAEGVEIAASLPCYLPENVDSQRGPGTFSKCIRALRRLNALGYGAAGGALPLSLVYNPQGPTLPPPQAALEADYRRALRQYGVSFTHLLVLCNMPIRRFRERLEREGGYADYLARLAAAGQPENRERVMCRTLISVDWQGRLYDCDFNQQLEMPIRGGDGLALNLADLLPGGAAADLADLQIAVGPHCHGCTAGQGSSCGGALS